MPSNGSDGSKMGPARPTFGPVFRRTIGSSTETVSHTCATRAGTRRPWQLASTPTGRNLFRHTLTEYGPTTCLPCASAESLLTHLRKGARTRNSLQVRRSGDERTFLAIFWG